eukprot:TRINITY_DN6923_c1_g1_i3.p1 TRINITY_DN6923_c1_g1~~TRINITY_DN6923_c1_g1_i3.p1  ORF type:complete len:159 (+),score=44.66 TRINITY_DN6923_c1_g1_i3:432-908(+)
MYLWHFGCGENVSPSDIRQHAYRLHDLFCSEDFKTAHRVPMHSLVVFAQDKQTDMWYGWRRMPLEWCSAEEWAGGKSHRVFCFQEEANAPLPKLVARSFTHFVQEVALGTRVDELGVKKTRVELGDDDEVEDDEELDEEDYYHPPRVLQPLPARGTDV